MNDHAREVSHGERFAFGENWERFLNIVNDARIEQAEISLRTMLKMDNLQGKRFLDIGSGSGLFSLAARRIGATVHSFDYDPQSVACTQELKRRYYPDDPQWVVENGSVLDVEYLAGLGKFDIVYSWGVLHHTGAMWNALENVASMVSREGGILFISIYNDQGELSRIWRVLKMIYNRLPHFVKLPYALAIMGPRVCISLIIATVRGRPGTFFRYVRDYSKYSMRGMSYWHDLIDWIGGYPFEVAKPEEIFSFFRNRKYRLEKLKTCGGRLGCNEYIFTRE